MPAELKNRSVVGSPVNWLGWTKPRTAGQLILKLNLTFITVNSVLYFMISHRSIDIHSYNL